MDEFFDDCYDLYDRCGDDEDGPGVADLLAEELTVWVTPGDTARSLAELVERELGFDAIDPEFDEDGLPALGGLSERAETLARRLLPQLRREWLADLRARRSHGRRRAPLRSGRAVRPRAHARRRRSPARRSAARAGPGDDGGEPEPGCRTPTGGAA